MYPRIKTWWVIWMTEQNCQTASITGLGIRTYFNPKQKELLKLSLTRQRSDSSLTLEEDIQATNAGSYFIFLEITL